MKILIPGCGYAHEAEYLHQKGFTNIYILDLASTPLEAFHRRVPSFPENYLLYENFFNHRGSYDLIVEQTFFCALHPSQRIKYVHKMAELIGYNYRITGLLFDVPLNDDQPPYGGSVRAYRDPFTTHFKILRMEQAQ